MEGIDEYTIESALMGDVPTVADLSAQENGDVLYNQRRPAYTLQAERPEHRIIIYLKAEGYSNIEIADKLGWTPAGVANIVKQPWAAKRIVDVIHEKGGDMVQQLLQGAAVDMVQQLITEAQHAGCSRDRIVAADKVLDRIYGKPNQSIVHHKGTDLNTLSDEQLATIAFPTGTPSSSPDASR
jgi:hypothetical protein